MEIDTGIQGKWEVVWKSFPTECNVESKWKIDVINFSFDWRDAINNEIDTCSGDMQFKAGLQKFWNGLTQKEIDYIDALLKKQETIEALTN